MSIFHATLLTIFPEMFPGPLGFSLAGSALKKGIWSYNIINIRDFGRTKHKNVDDKAYGGGHGLIMRPDVLGAALDTALELNPESKIYYPSPRGKLITQAMCKHIADSKNIIILCGRFEGIDERVIDEYNAQQVSTGDYILSGGEIAAFATLDSIIRLLPGVLANQNVLKEESFEQYQDGSKFLEYPLYTKPAIWREREVPEILLSGNAKLIKQWKKEQSLKITKTLRPDLLKENN